MKEGVVKRAKRLHVPTVDEVGERIKHRYRSLRGRSLKDLKYKQLGLVYNVLSSSYSCIREFSRLWKEAGEFYKDLISVEYDLNEVEKCLKKLVLALKVMKEVWESYRYALLGASGRSEVRDIAKEGIGRLMSLVKRNSRCIDLVKNVLKTLSRMPEVCEGCFTIIVAGVPNSGKSTFVSSVSTAKPEVAAYPFTTKSIVIGHIKGRVFDVQVVDTPGLLDRPLSDRNPIELRAIAALRSLPGVVLYLVDPTESYYPLEPQLRVLKEVATFCRKKVYVAINKVDAVRQEVVSAIARRIADYVASESLSDVRCCLKLCAKDESSAKSVVRVIVSGEAND